MKIGNFIGKERRDGLGYYNKNFQLYHLIRKYIGSDVEVDTGVACRTVGMFFVKQLSLAVTLPPSALGGDMPARLRQQLLHDVEGTCTGRFGYVICVLNWSQIDSGKGLVMNNSGNAKFDVKYTALVWRPFKGEVVDGIVSSVNSMGFFADVGPLSIFISRHLIPSDMRYAPAHSPPAYIGDSDGQVVHVGGKVRIKIIGTRHDVDSISAIGSIKEDYLGPL